MDIVVKSVTEFKRGLLKDQTTKKNGKFLINDIKKTVSQMSVHRMYSKSRRIYPRMTFINTFEFDKLVLTIVIIIL